MDRRSIAAIAVAATAAWLVALAVVGLVADATENALPVVATGLLVGVIILAITGGAVIFVGTD